MRPKSIVNFERLYLAAIAIEVGRLAIEWSMMMQSSASHRWGRVASIAATLLLVLVTSRRRKRVAGVLLAALFVIGLPMIATVFQPGTGAAVAGIVVTQLLLQAIALALLFTHASRAWFRADGAAADATDPAA